MFKLPIQCSSKVTEEQRQSIFDTYWSKQNYELQREFLCQNISTTQTKRHYGKTKRRKTAATYFIKTEDKTYRVCKSFFLKTLDIGKKTVDLALKKQQHGAFPGCDMRGKSSPANKTPDADVNFVHDHIKSFPTVESHYVRKTLKRKYLSGELNITKMYTMYKEMCSEKQRKCVSAKVYRKIFCENYNYSFHKPKKDQCSVCNLYEQHKLNNTLDNDMEKKYQDHQRLKELARKEKEIDKKKCKEDKTFHACTFDLEAVLSTPCSLIGELYYKRKLSCYNLTFYSLRDKKGLCYLWDECQGGRGSSEIGSCMLMYISRLTEKFSSIKQITFYSDSCGGQNRNQFVASALFYSLFKNSKIEIINQKFFERGHSEMEADSMHSAIERAKNCTSIFVPSQWSTVISMARKHDPYVVIPLKYDNFKDLKKLKSTQCSNMKVDITGKSVNWLQVKWIQCRRNATDSIFLNYTFDENHFKEVRIRSTRKRGIKVKLQEATPLYTNKLPVSQAKKADLMSLCASGIIPSEFHKYYADLPSNKTSRDTVDDDSDTDTDA